MITKPVVLVLGAGASFPYGFPLGNKLRDDAVNDSKKFFPEALEKVGFTIEQLEEFRGELRKAMTPSIDAFLESRDAYLDIGKAVMAYFLIRCEDESTLYRTGNNQDWYAYLYGMMGHTDPSQFSKNKLSIITYNYDRSFEYSFLNALKVRHNLSNEEAGSILNSIPIIHVHGKLGELKELDSNGRPYNRDVSAESMKIAMNGIKVVHEDIDDDPAFLQAREVLATAEHIVFLGFGYHRRNIERLDLANSIDFKAKVIATIIGKTGSEVRNIITPLFQGVDKDNFYVVNVHEIGEYPSVLDLFKNRLEYFI